MIPAAPQPPAPARSSWPAVLVALGAGAAVLVIVGIFVPAFALLLLLAGGAFGLVAGLHYLVWGRWLGRLAQQDEAERGGMGEREE